MRILFYDTETTGLPGKNVPGCGITHSTSGYPRPVQIGWIITDELGNELKREMRYVSPDNFKMPERTAQFNGITTEKLQMRGESEDVVLNAFLMDLFTCDYEVGHNIVFDKNTILSRLSDLGRKHDYAKMFNHPAVCTMKGSYAWCGLRKSPKLIELYTMLFGCGFDGAHDAMADISATKDCYFEMIRHNIMSYPRLI